LAERTPELAVTTWGDKSAGREVVKGPEQALEQEVSRYIGAMPVLALEVPDEPGPDSLRGYIERNSIALLSAFHNRELDLPSDDWLGHFCPREKVRRSGLWNNRHVEETYDPAFLGAFERLVVADKDPR
jgi:hypothetical protein